MGIKNNRIVLWVGNAPNQRALANKIGKEFELAGIVLDTGKKKKKTLKIMKLTGRIIDYIRFYKIYSTWKQLLKHYNQAFPDWPSVPILKVAGINDPSTTDFTTACNADLIVVSGTAMIKEPLLSTPVTIGIINLHTGLSPYIKGGPNCTNWCIAKDNWELVGNTIMWLNAGIDAGNIITTETIDIRKEVDLLSAHIKVMEHAHDLYLRAIEYIFTCQPPYNSVTQESIGKGRLFLNKMWTAKERKNLLSNWKERSGKELKNLPTTVPLRKLNKA